MEFIRVQHIWSALALLFGEESLAWSFFRSKLIKITFTYSVASVLFHLEDHPQSTYAQIWWFLDSFSLFRAFKQQNDVIKTIDIRFCLEPLPLPSSARTLWMVPCRNCNFLVNPDETPRKIESVSDCPLKLF